MTGPSGGGITLSQATATCPECGHQVHQISATREHARAVVVEAMEKHMAEHSSSEGESS